MDKGDKSRLIRGLSEYIFYGFPLMQELGTVDDVVRMVIRNLHHIVYIKERGRIVFVMIYMMLTDSTLEKFISGELSLENPDTFERLEKENGNNVHVFTIRSDRMGFILKAVHSIIKNLKPKTFSYYRDDDIKNLIFLKREK